MSSGRAHRLTLISAPAGFGKTTLLTAWASAASGPVCWVSLDRGDTDPTRFWTHVIAALAGHEPLAGTTSLAALRAHPGDFEAYTLPRLLDEIPREGPELTLVLDDFHLAETPQVASNVAAFLRYRPDRLHLVVATRSDPALGVARLRASGDLLEIRAEDLRFDDRELASFLDGMGVVGLSAEDQRRLAHRTGGWPAPLRLLALLMPDDNRGDFMESLAGGSRTVVDYLTSDVLDLLSADVHEFVLRSSVLERMNASLCDAVLARTGSGAVLAHLERSNFFTSVDATGEWYQLHHLFAEALRLELTRSRPDLVPELHRRAAAWFEASGDLETATTHAIQARDLAMASRLVSQQSQPFVASGRWATVVRWLSDLDWPDARTDPELAFDRAIAAAFRNDVDVTVSWLDVAGTGPPGMIGAMGLPLGFRTDFLRAMVGVNDVSVAEAAGRRALESAPTPAWRGVALAGLGQAQYLRGEYVAAQQSLRRAVGLIPDANPVLLHFAIGNLALAEFTEGSSRHAAPLLDSALERIRSIGQGLTPSGAILNMACGERARADGDARTAVQWFDAAIAMLGPNSRNAWLANAHLLRAAACRTLGDVTGQTRSLDLADAILDRLPDPGALVARSRDLRRRASGPMHHATAFGEQLSGREITVLQLAAAGLTQREIAQQLFISYNTVKSHLKATYRKLGASSRDEAMDRWADLNESGQAPLDPGGHPGDPD
jgi:LuxR family maltose regulon positive regulatory protein